MVRFVVPDVHGELALDLELECGDVVATNRDSTVVVAARAATWARPSRSRPTGTRPTRARPSGPASGRQLGIDRGPLGAAANDGRRHGVERADELEAQRRRRVRGVAGWPAAAAAASSRRRRSAASTASARRRNTSHTSRMATCCAIRCSSSATAGSSSVFSSAAAVAARPATSTREDVGQVLAALLVAQHEAAERGVQRPGARARRARATGRPRPGRPAPTPGGSGTGPAAAWPPSGAASAARRRSRPTWTGRR